MLSYLCEKDMDNIFCLKHVNLLRQQFIDVLLFSQSNFFTTFTFLVRNQLYLLSSPRYIIVQKLVNVKCFCQYIVLFFLTNTTYCGEGGKDHKQKQSAYS